MMKNGHAMIILKKINIHGSGHMLFIWYDLIGFVHFELLQTNEAITNARYWA